VLEGGGWGGVIVVFLVVVFLLGGGFFLGWVFRCFFWGFFRLGVFLVSALGCLVCMCFSFGFEKRVALKRG